jgi:molybdopterin-guanine dinucleotide biosynthesis protein A
MPVESGGEGVVGLLLAGGQARRMGGGDKCLRTLAGETLLARAIARARSQVSHLLLNANGGPGRFASYGLTVVPDVIDGFAGPLAGVLSGLTWLSARQSETAWLATFPTDAPFFPLDLVSRMRAVATEQGAKVVCAASGGRSHPVFGLWHGSLKDDLERAMVDEGTRKIDAWTATHGLIEVGYDCEPIDPFFNANRPEDLESAALLLAEMS